MVNFLYAVGCNDGELCMAASEDGQYGKRPVISPFRHDASNAVERLNAPEEPPDTTPILMRDWNRWRLCKRGPHSIIEYKRH